MSQKCFKHILVDKENYNHLRQLGNVGDSFNDVITFLLENHRVGGLKIEQD